IAVRPAARLAWRITREHAGLPGPEPPPSHSVTAWEGGVGGLMQRGEFRRDDEHVLLPDELAAGCRWPSAGFAGLVADAEALGGVLVGPDMDPLVERPELGMPAEGERREFLPALDPLGPFLDDRRGGARQHRVGADLVKIAELARLQLGRERRRDDYLAFHLLDEFLDLGRP